MMRGKIVWPCIGIAAALGAVLLGWQRSLVGHLRAERQALGDQSGELARLRAENQRLAHAQLTSEERATAGADQTDLPSLRQETETLRGQLVAAKRAETERAEHPSERFSRGQAMPAAEWTNAGAATPAAALETALWAAAGGDIDAFARRIGLWDSAAKKAARELLDGLPPGLRPQFNSPEQLIAFLTIKDIPTGSATVREWFGDSETKPWRVVEVALTAPDGRGREVRLMLLPDPVTQEWKFSVRSAAIATLAAALKEPLNATDPK